MIEIEDLQKACNDIALLQNYLSDNFEQVYDFFTNQKHSELVLSRDKLNRFIQLKRNTILQLDIYDKANLAFISLLLDISEELGLISSFSFLYNHLKGKEYNIGERLKAASLYLIGVKTADDYVNRYEEINKHLQRSSETEEDNTDRVLMTMVNYYAQVIYDFGEFNIDKVKQLKTKIENSLIDYEFSFLHNKLVEDVLKVDLSNFSDAYKNIHTLLDLFLGRDIIKPVYSEEFLLEAGTEYCDLLNRVSNSFQAVRQISVIKYRLVMSDYIFNSLGRGVTILTDENQLFAYMYSYGDMHYEKLYESFKKLPAQFFDQETNLIDWGCGQAIAAMVYFDFLNQNGITQTINKITLIEPSKIALKRASLHMKKINANTEIKIINKDFDALDNQDFNEYNSPVQAHLFSNVLDIDDFLLTDLLELIETNFSGDNYFICVSPYINDTRTSRLNAFVKYFSKKENFELFESIDNRYDEWKNSWTRVVRVFKVTL